MILETWICKIDIHISKFLGITTFPSGITVLAGFYGENCYGYYTVDVCFNINKWENQVDIISVVKIPK